MFLAVLSVALTPRDVALAERSARPLARQGTWHTWLTKCSRVQGPFLGMDMTHSEQSREHLTWWKIIYERCLPNKDWISSAWLCEKHKMKTTKIIIFIRRGIFMVCNTSKASLNALTNCINVFYYYGFTCNILFYRFLLMTKQTWTLHHLIFIYYPTYYICFYGGWGWVWWAVWSPIDLDMHECYVCIIKITLTMGKCKRSVTYLVNITLWKEFQYQNGVIGSDFWSTTTDITKFCVAVCWCFNVNFLRSVISTSQPLSKKF